jgi:diketogulonate reductase-like aldo/keto reductase
MKATVFAFLASVASALPQGYPVTPMHGVSGNVDMPMVGLGTWLYNDTVASNAVVEAFRQGYRHVDTALIYGNHEGVGQGLKHIVSELGLAREDYFVTSKIPGGLNASATTASLEQTLEELQLESLDLMLLHFPADWSGEGGPAKRKEEWLALEAWAKQGKARAIGVSHYCQSHLEDVLSVATLPVALNQNQYHVGMGQDSESRKHNKAFSEDQGVLYMSYSSLCGPCNPPDNMELITGDLVTGIGKKHNKSGAQVALRWLVQQGIPIIPKSSNPKHLAANFDVFDFTLSDEEMTRLSAATTPAETGTEQQPDDAQDCDLIGNAIFA